VIIDLLFFLYIYEKLIFRREYINIINITNTHWQLRLPGVNHSQMPIICALQLMSACVTVLVLLHYDYNTIRNGPSIRANHYNYDAGSGKGITHEHPVKSVRDN